MQYSDSDFDKFSEAHKRLSKLVLAAMKTDYGNLFTSQFKDGNTSRAWLYRFLELTAPYDAGLVADAVENMGKANPNHPPTLQQIRSEAHRLTIEAAKADENMHLVNAMREKPSQAGIDKINALREAAHAKRDKRGILSREEMDKLIETHNAMVYPYSVAAQRLVRERGSLAHFRTGAA